MPSVTSHSLTCSHLARVRSCAKQAGTILFLYLTHKLISLRPGHSMTASETQESCRRSLEGGGATHTLFGRTSLPAIESAYDKVEAAYSVWSADE